MDITYPGVAGGALSDMKLFCILTLKRQLLRYWKNFLAKDALKSGIGLWMGIMGSSLSVFKEAVVRSQLNHRCMLYTFCLGGFFYFCESLWRNHIY